MARCQQDEFCHFDAALGHICVRQKCHTAHVKWCHKVGLVVFSRGSEGAQGPLKEPSGNPQGAL